MGISRVEGRIVGENLAGMDDIIGLGIFNRGISAIDSECLLHRCRRGKPEVLDPEGREGSNEKYTGGAKNTLPHFFRNPLLKLDQDFAWYENFLFTIAYRYRAFSIGSAGTEDDKGK
jgi:hypothetical protein